MPNNQPITTSRNSKSALRLAQLEGLGYGPELVEDEAHAVPPAKQGPAPEAPHEPKKESPELDGRLYSFQGLYGAY